MLTSPAEVGLRIQREICIRHRFLSLSASINQCRSRQSCPPPRVLRNWIEAPVVGISEILPRTDPIQDARHYSPVPSCHRQRVNQTETCHSFGLLKRERVKLVERAAIFDEMTGWMRAHD